jgi:hypothetical protein
LSRQCSIEGNLKREARVRMLCANAETKGIGKCAGFDYAYELVALLFVIKPEKRCDFVWKSTNRSKAQNHDFLALTWK